jgi:phosphatidylserine decarboxylase
MKIAREALPIALILVGVFAAGVFLLHPLIAVPGVLLLVFTLWFFRDPERTTPRVPGALISPADGKIIRTGPDRISVFMNVFNVHICRAPSDGVLETVEHKDGRFLAAFKDHASEQNERVLFVLTGDGPEIRFTLIAGLVARRIVPKVRAGQRLEAGQRVGLIQFGSRVDVDLPPDYEATVAIGEHVVAGETVIARCTARSAASGQG